MTTTNQRAVEELLPCPFCNSPAEYLGSEANGYEVGCSRCGAKAGWGDYGYQAAQKWNRRTPGWRPISEAPRDGTDVLVYVRGETLYPTAAHYDTPEYFEKEYGDREYMEEGWRWSFGYPTDFHEETIEPTHFMPLPPPPGK
jgi:hypothetical protein